MSTVLRDIGPVMLVGAGKMGLALAKGWLDAGFPPQNLVLVDPHPSADAVELAEDFGLTVNSEAVGLQPNVLVLAVKPQIIDTVLTSLAPVIGSHTMAISIVAGVDIERLSRGLGMDRVVRTMPNTPAQIGQGITGLVASAAVSREERATAEALLQAAGQVVWLDEESQIDAVTAVSGSGPAYVFHLVEALAAAGKTQGLPDHVAEKLARQTVIGSAALMAADAIPPAVLRENVTSPNGTTAAGLAVLMANGGLTDLIGRTVEAARRRSEELGRA
ncbi:MAG TPA: pyrroline-5-carboxylate reductase [Devosia sp.]|jgi:pyrroline-5-carboxylate reductase|uniref:pyrroline-5-carboxylate reductase n=1 Tax=Devosia sp. TaxID=1871048 RepID=UPI002F95A758